MAESGKDPNSPSTRAGFCTLFGRPNVGKSTLLNALLGSKVAIVSHRPQTTRNRILGVRTEGDDQLVVIDTPGVHRRRANLNRFMVQEALGSLAGIDTAVLVTEVARDAAAIHAEDRYALELLSTHLAEDQVQRQQIVVVVNKIDRLTDKRLLLPLIEAWHAQGLQRIVPISALQKDGIDALWREITSTLPHGPHLYAQDMLTDRAERFLAAELVREQVFHRCRQELPHAVAVEVEAFDERKDGEVAISALIHVERESQKAIVIGKGGTMIKAIGEAARAAIGELLGCTVHLRLQVHVEPDWTHNPASRRRFGYE
ncbi:MAG: GTPase Era [Deltaproteobacteria bacterium]|nr:GTPase Era [Deltaproteobacteria bacterium]